MVITTDTMTVITATITEVITDIMVITAILHIIRTITAHIMLTIILIIQTTIPEIQIQLTDIEQLHRHHLTGTVEPVHHIQEQQLILAIRVHIEALLHTLETLTTETLALIGIRRQQDLQEQLPQQVLHHFIEVQMLM